MGHTVIEDVEDRVDDSVIRQKIIKTDDPTVPERLPIRAPLRLHGRSWHRPSYDNENETTGRHERHTPEETTEIEFPGMVALRDRFLDEVDQLP